MDEALLDCSIDFDEKVFDNVKSDSSDNTNDIIQYTSQASPEESPQEILRQQETIRLAAQGNNPMSNNVTGNNDTKAVGSEVDGRPAKRQCIEQVLIQTTNLGGTSASASSSGVDANAMVAMEAVNNPRRGIQRYEQAAGALQLMQQRQHRPAPAALGAPPAVVDNYVQPLEHRSRRFDDGVFDQQAQFSWRQPLQATQGWASIQPRQQQEAFQPAPMGQVAPPPMQRPQQPNFAPPIVNRQQVQHSPYNTTLDLQPIPAPGGHHIEGRFTHPFSSSELNRNVNIGNALPHWQQQQFVPTLNLPIMQQAPTFDPFWHLDLTDFLPLNTINAIRCRAYVDFAKLLPDNVEDPTDDYKYVPVKDGAVQTFQKTKRIKPKEIDGLMKWIRAFCVWSFVFLDSHPNEAKGLFQYLHNILDGDRRFVWSEVYNYDKQVRHGLERDHQRKIGPLDLRKWQMVTSYVKSTRPYQNRNSTPLFRKTNQANFHGNSRATCINFNRGNCERKKCRFLHACSNCKQEDHVGSNCKQQQRI